MSDPDNREFPGFTNVYEDEAELPVEQISNLFSRRQFLASSTIAALAAASGCRRPDLKILPHGQTPDNLTPGMPTFYATSMPKPGGCFPILVETHDGRPTKIEGHPTHPASMGGCDVFTQASIYDLYSPDRSKEVLKRNAEGRLVPSTWEAFDAFAATHFAELRKKEGEGLAFLLEDNPSPALRLLREHMKERFPKAVWVVFEPVGNMNETHGAYAFDLPGMVKEDRKEGVVRGALTAVHHFEKAKRIVSLNCDFLGLDGNSVANARAFAEGRRSTGNAGAKEPNRLYVVESTYTVTGSMADHRLRLPDAYVTDYAAALAKEIATLLGEKVPAAVRDALNQVPVRNADISQSWIKEVAADLVAYAGKGLVLTCNRNKLPAPHLFCRFINEILGNTGVTIEYRQIDLDDMLSWHRLTSQAGPNLEMKYDTLVIIGGNPSFNSSAGALGIGRNLTKFATIIRFGQYVDETSDIAAWHLPMSHYLESWGDAECEDGTYCSIQPMISPLHASRSSLEFLIQISGWDKATTHADAKVKTYALLHESFKKRTGNEDELAFKQFIQEGFVKNSDRKKIAPKLKVEELVSEFRHAWATMAITDGEFEISFRPDYRLYDGRFAWNSWLLELPDPVTKLVWDNAALISPKAADALKVKTGDVLEISNPIVWGGALRIPAFILPGQADETITVNFGFGKQRIGRVPAGGGFDVYPFRSLKSFCTAASVKKTNETYDLVTTQEHGTIPAEKKHEIIREHSVHDHHPAHEHQHDDPKSRFQWGYDQSKYKDAAQDDRDLKRIALQQAEDVSYPQRLDGDMQWGMVIDLNTCTGCSACVIACQAENNIPVVGKHEVKLNREMHWISVHRYFTSTKGEVHGGLEQSPADDPGIITQPMMCQHCEAAPCESVCPVNAAVHSPEGLNLQVFNRCIGTRYCSNNCPYKARRFNWFDFNKRRLDELRVPTPFSEAGMPETLKMQKNPEVTVRMRGVMEKCTYCIQRIERAKIGAKVLAIKAGADKPDAVAPASPYEAGYDIQIIDGVPRIVVPDGIIKTACEQACPSQAITFGNLRDKNSRVYKLKNTGDDYLVLGSLNTKPRTSYLPRLRNPNPKMGDGA